MFASYARNETSSVVANQWGKRNGTILVSKWRRRTQNSLPSNGN
jgi:hypothetical protein